MGRPREALGEIDDSLPRRHGAAEKPTTDLDGQDISGKFDEQVRTVFALMNRTLERAGASLSNLVTMTVFINDPRHGDRFVQIRRELFPDGR